MGRGIATQREECILLLDNTQTICGEMDWYKKMEETPKAVSDEKTKVVSIVIEIYSDGSRQLRVDSADKNIPLVLVREWLEWAGSFVNDKIYAGIISSKLAEVMQEKIIKPGFRPLKILDRLRGRG
jgi:hypothetical protein